MKKKKKKKMMIKKKMIRNKMIIIEIKNNFYFEVIRVLFNKSIRYKNILVKLIVYNFYIN